jgi:hypothetical protein
LELLCPEMDGICEERERRRKLMGRKKEDYKL